MTAVRRILTVLAGIVVVVVLLGLTAIYTLLQPERFSAMLQAQARAAGLELHLASPASPSLLPRPAIDLHGITINAINANAPILLAARGRLALPWQALFDRQTLISQMQIDAPRVDLDALQAWLGERSPHITDRTPGLARIDTGISISRGSLVRGNRVMLANLSLDTGSLLPGQPFPLTLAADTAQGEPLRVRLVATPLLEDGSLRLQDIDLRLAQGSDLHARLDGHASWQGAANAMGDLSGQIEHADGQRYALDLRLIPADENLPLNLHITLDGEGQHVDVRVPPLALANWWSALTIDDAPQLSMPPLDGKLDIEHLNAGTTGIDGLQIRAGSAVPAASGSTAEPPANLSP